MICLVRKGFVYVLISSSVIWWGANETFAATVDVSILSTGAFSPDTVNINTGDTVRWTSSADNQQVASNQHPSHTEYPDPVCPGPACFDSLVLNTDDTFSFTFQLGGTWEYHNHQKPGKTGEVIVADQNTPAVVSDLAASNPTSSTIDLTWISPGDDVGSTGNFLTPTTYDVRYSTSIITEANWSSATQATDEPTPSVAGFVESMTVAGLSSLTTYYFAIKTSDEVPNTSALSNVTSSATLAPSGDTIAPAAVTDLALSNPTTSSIDLTWTAPGDDDNTGTAQSYDIRYSAALVTDGNWSSATKVIGEPTPSIAGSSESMTVAGLSESTTYYFALKTSDEEPNISDLSNVPSLATSSSSSPTISSRGSQGTFSNIPPAVITDLFALNETASSIDLVWTAPGEDGTRGMATSYDIRYSTEPIGDKDWEFATQVTGEPIPSIAFQLDSMTVSELSADVMYYFTIKATDKWGNESRLSNVWSLATVPLPDTTAPAAIFDLIAFDTTEPSSVNLTWTAPGDDGDMGLASSYDVRYSTEVMTEESWESAVSFIDTRIPKEAGHEEVFIAKGFDYGITYYIGIKTVDKEGNESGLSNVVSFDTLEPVFDRPLRRGVENPDVKRLQELLSQDAEVYSEGLITGFFGDATEAAVKRFQAKYGLEETGIVDLVMSIKLAEVLGEAVEPTIKEIFLRPLFIGVSGEDVRLLQEFLARDPTFYPEGLVTGFFGPLTDQAVGRLQVRYGILLQGDPVLGAVGPKTRAKLNELFAESSEAPSSEESPTIQEPLLEDIQSQINAILERIKDIQKQFKTLL